MRRAIQFGGGAISPAGCRQRDGNPEFAADSPVFVPRRAAVNDAGLSRRHAAGLFAP